MKRIHAAGVVVAILLFTPLEASAKSSGVGFAGKGHHAKPTFSHRPFANRHGFRGYPWGYPWGFFAQTNYLVPGDVPNEVVVFPPEPPRFLNCQRNREITEVPSERGGTREIMVTRC